MDYGDPALPPRFWDKVYPCPITGCWFWAGAQHDTLPYGVWRNCSGRNGRAHVSSFVANGGIISDEKPYVLHSCDQPSCVRPEHLRAGTAAENTDDARRRKRFVVGAKSPLNPGSVAELRERYAAGAAVVDLTAEFGVSGPAISQIVRGISWSDASGPITLQRPRAGSPSPARNRSTCTYGHELTPENVRWKPNPACRDGYERQCILCRQRLNREQAARRKAARAAVRERKSAA